MVCDFYYIEKLNLIMMKFRVIRLKLGCYLSNFNLQKMFLSNQLCKNDHINKLSSVLEINQSTINEMVYTSKGLLNINPKLIGHSMEVLLDHNFSKEEIIDYPKILLLTPSKIDNIINIYKEIGISTITLSLIEKFLIIYTKKKSFWIKYGYIPQDYNITNHLSKKFSKYVDVVPKIEHDHSSINDLHYNLYITVVKNYLEFENSESLNKTLKIYKRARFKSIKLFLDQMDRLINDIGFTKERIRNNYFTTFVHLRNIDKILQNKPRFGTIPSKNILYKYPRILLTTYEDLELIDSYFKEFKITDEAIEKCINIYSLNPQTIYERLNKSRTIPEFLVLFNHPRFLILIFYFKSALKRLDYFIQNNIKHFSINNLSVTSKYFKRFTLTGLDRTKSFDIIYLLKDLMGLEEDYIKFEINRQHNWNHVTLADIKLTYLYLTHIGFTKEQISNTLQILSYQKETIKHNLENLDKNIELTPEFLHLSPQETNKFIEDKKLQLCLYFIEKHYHFNGGGIWENLKS